MANRNQITLTRLQLNAWTWALGEKPDFFPLKVGSKMTSRLKASKELPLNSMSKIVKMSKEEPLWTLGLSVLDICLLTRVSPIFLLGDLVRFETHGDCPDRFVDEILDAHYAVCRPFPLEVLEELEPYTDYLNRHAREAAVAVAHLPHASRSGAFKSLYTHSGNRPTHLKSIDATGDADYG